MNINKSICMQLLSVAGCEIKGFKNEQTNVMGLAIYKNNGKIGEFKNDGMNKVGIKGKGESVWLGFFLYGIIDDFVKLMNKYDKEFKVDEYIKFNEKLNDNLNKKAWDGEYYLRA